MLNTPPTTLAGSIAVLNFLHDYLKGEPDIALAARGVAHVTAALSAIAYPERRGPASFGVWRVCASGDAPLNTRLSP